MKVRVNIVLKPSVLDPQGQAVANSLIGQGFNNIKNVRPVSYTHLTLPTNA